jgi:hypothetical protein
MLRLVKLVDRFGELEHALPEGWADAQLLLTVEDDARCDRAAALLGPANPGRRGKRISLTSSRRGRGIAPESLRRLLRRIDEEGIAAQLEVLGADEAPPAELERRESLRDQWDRALAGLPSDWSDLYAEVQVDSTDFIERGALLLAPVNPARYGGVTGLRFRCARRFGYGVSTDMAGRCLTRCDDEGITGRVEILRALSDTYPVATQGPVWYVGGRSV